MSRYTKTALILLAASALCWGICIAADPAKLQLLAALAAVVFSVMFICFLVIGISRRINKNISPYRIFAVTDGLIGLCVVLYAAYDILTDTGWFAGITGVLLLILVLPIILALMLADFIVWRLRRSDK